MTSPATAFRNRRPNRAERRAARSQRATGKTVRPPRHACGRFTNEQAVNPYDTQSREFDAVNHPERLRPRT